jgi:hypothetical protein
VLHGVAHRAEILQELKPALVFAELPVSGQLAKFFPRFRQRIDDRLHLTQFEVVRDFLHRGLVATGILCDLVECCIEVGFAFSALRYCAIKRWRLIGVRSRRAGALDFENAAVRSSTPRRTRSLSRQR